MYMQNVRKLPHMKYVMWDNVFVNLGLMSERHFTLRPHEIQLWSDHTYGTLTRDRITLV